MVRQEKGRKKFLLKGVRQKVCLLVKEICLKVSIEYIMDICTYK